MKYKVSISFSPPFTFLYHFNRLDVAGSRILNLWLAQGFIEGMMAALTAVNESQSKSYNFVVESRLGYNKTKLWLDELFIEARKLFEKPTQQEELENEDVEEHDTPGPVLLPQTPRQKSARAERLMKRTKYVLNFYFCSQALLNFLFKVFK